jgi:NADPH2:quinone reductase
MPAMKASWYERTGPAANVLLVGELPSPQPGPGEVLVRIHASGINPSDTKMRAGWGNTAMAFPLVVPHADGAGEVVAVAPGVDRSLLHTRVWLYNATALYNASRAMGTAAEYCALPADQVVPLAEGTEYVQGACLGVPACTAHRAVFSEGPVDGKTILVQGGAGCVAHYAIQFARLAGARIIATVSSAEKAAQARTAGAHETVTYTEEDVVQRVLELAGAQGVDSIIEVDLGANLPIDVQLIRTNGHIASYSSTSVPEPVFPYYPLALKGVSLRLVQGFNLPAAARAAAIGDITGWCERRQLKHAVGAVFPLDQISLAHEAVEQRTVMGNVVVQIS